MVQKITSKLSAKTAVAKFIAKLLEFTASTRTKRKNNTGNEGEDRAVIFLKQKKYKILQTNYNCRTGEIDIVAKDKKTFVFVEVKTRREGGKELPEAALTPKKRHRLCKAAQHFMRNYNLKNPLFRFDLIGLEYNENNEWKILHWENIINYQNGLVRKY